MLNKILALVVVCQRPSAHKIITSIFVVHDRGLIVEATSVYRARSINSCLELLHILVVLQGALNVFLDLQHSVL